MSFGERKKSEGLKEFTPFSGHLEFPYNGKTYTPRPISYELGLQLKLFQEQVSELQAIVADNLKAQRAAEEAGEEPPETKPVPEYEWSEDEGPTPENMLGEDLLAELKADNVPFEFVQLATHTMWMDFLYGRDTAEAYWNSGGDPKAVAEILYGSGRDHKIPLTSTSTGEAHTTKPRASTNGTKSRKKPSKSSTTTTKTTTKKPAKSASATKKS